jgi:hypothetical protein
MMANTTSVAYSTVNPDVAYEAGKTLEQWTIRFINNTSNAFGLIKVRFSHTFSEMIEFEVELNGIPLEDKQGKDVTVNWRMYDGFNSNKTFWTDTNGLEMQQRWVDYQPTFPRNKSSEQHIANNFYPVTSAIAMKDFSRDSSKMVVILNDRTQAGSSGLDSSSIELMQNRRLMQDDIRGVEEPLNERDPKGFGLKVTAKYHMQIFDRSKGVPR